MTEKTFNTEEKIQKFNKDNEWLEALISGIESDKKKPKSLDRKPISTKQQRAIGILK